MKRQFLVAIGVVFLIAVGRPGSGMADIYVYRDAHGVLHFTNAPSQAGFKRVMRDGGGVSSETSRGPNHFEDLIRSASHHHGVDPDLVRAVIKAESDFRSDARSHKGAMGLMQLMPETARLHNVNDAYDPGDNINGGVSHLKLLIGRYNGDVELTLAAYNAGIKAVEKYGGVPPYSETRQYVRRVLRYYQSYRGDGLSTLRQQVSR